MKHFWHHSASSFFRRAFSLIEIMVTVALLSVIILGLVAMFDQTRRAFTSSITQVDVLESGRDATALIAQQMEQMAASSISTGVNFFVETPSTAPPMTQALVDPSDVRTNILQDVFFLTRLNQTWTGVGYKVFNSGGTTGGSLGTLYRYAGVNIPATNGFLIGQQWTNFNLGAPGTNFTRIVDGVVDFTIRAYDTNGNLYPFITTFPSISTNYLFPLQSSWYYRFTSNSLPAYVEVELGVLEDRTLARYQAIAGPANINLTAANNYLADHPGQVHVFRQRIPIRNVSSAAYQ
ncbi:MAG TPA: prepilin-type N-terminal cleavage/methylation domain-containing protein [Verrucomicrobiae bacterium]|jgi:prepilin-type N-terminal cleavage/methylation domain-containing protein|nr:prepilin-type N-terminal cleavage/methylation domain-containing protein [Verrucomicrobiae bacterium]